MRILAFGYHDQTAPRHWNISRDMLAEGIQLVECHTTERGLWKKLRDLTRRYKALRKNADGVFVTFPGQALLPFAWLLTRIFPPGRPAGNKKILMFDAFIGLHDTVVGDRKLLSRWNPYGWFLFFLDWLACRLADVVFVDTEAHRRFFMKRFGLRPERVKVAYLGTRTDLFHPRKGQHEKRNVGSFEVLFYGSYIPLQGIEVILAAAKILRDTHPAVRFTLIGKGQTLPAMRSLAEKWNLTNVRFQPPVAYQMLPDWIRAADLSLGIFGTSGKAQRVIPHKVYDAVACGIPLITADTPAIREKFAKHPLVTLIPAGDPKALAEAIRERV